MFRTGLKPVSRQSSDYIAGVPIKKRRFPLFNHSPPSEEPSSILTQSDSLTKDQSDLLQKEQSSPSQGSTISNASIATSSCMSDANKKLVSEERKRNPDFANATGVQSNPNYSRVKLETPSLEIHSGSLDNTDCEDKVVAAEKSARQITLGKTKLQLAPDEALSLTVGKEIYSEEKFKKKGKVEISTVPGNTELTLGIKENPFPALENSVGRGQNQGTLESGLLTLSLSKGNSSNQCKNDDIALNSGVQQCANRANWDLNTTMDAWGSSASDAAAGHVTGDGAEDIKPKLGSMGMIGMVAASCQNSLLVIGNKANLTIPSKLSGQNSNLVDSLHLGLSPSSLQLQVRPEPSSLAGKEDSGRVFPGIALPRLVASTSNSNRVNCRTVKSEPFDESIKVDNVGNVASNMRIITNTALKHELRNFGFDKSSQISALKLVDRASLKTEPVYEGSEHVLNTIEGTSQPLDKHVLQGLSDQSFAMAQPATAHMSCPVGEPSCSTELTIASDVANNLANNLEHPKCAKGAHSNGELVPQGASETAMQVAPEDVALSAGHDSKELSDSVMTETVRAGGGNADDPEQHRVEFVNGHLSDMRGTEGSASDEEKINISADMLEEDSYSSDYESDGNHPLARAMDIEQDGEEDDYEDGEVREPAVHNVIEEPACDKQEVDCVNLGDSDNRKMDSVGQHGGHHPTSAHIEENEVQPEDSDELENKDIVDNPETVKVVSDYGANKPMCMQESLPIETLPTGTGTGTKRTDKELQSKLLVDSGSKDCLKEQGTELSSEQTTKEEAVVPVTQDAYENVDKPVLGEMKDTALPKIEASANGDDAAKDINSGGNQRRIINLSRASNVSSPGKSRPISARSLPSRAGRERLPDVALEAEKLLPRGRGRITSRSDTLHGEWDSDRDFTSQFYNGPTEFRVSRHKYASAAPGADFEYGNYNAPPDGAFFGTGRGGRNHLNNEGAIFRPIPSRRRSPGGREASAGRGGVQMVRRVPRNVSPGRCIDEDGSEVVGLRHSEKFMRVFPEDTIDPMFGRPQPAYEGVGGHFVRGARNFSSVQRRGLPRIRSKSPIRSRSRSPVQWISPRRRSQDEFGGHPELTHRRSPPIFRMEGMRSPGFTREHMVRRHGSPQYLSRPSNDLGDMESGRDHGHPRSVIPNRNQSDRIILRNRRYPVIDPRERAENDEFFGGPMNTGRLHEVAADANGDERRRFAERRGPVHSFRPPYNEANNGGFHLNSEDAPGPFRFCPEDDSKFHQRGNLRDREFDRRIKNQSGNAPTRTRSIEEQEANYRRGGEVWHDDGFDELSRVKRKRF
ncbi:hypothetical protein CJ030_MR3G014585 [Morella rubra]|uniref:Uncharacterized protein n=1 Tax=Morella rubra TaxID=262757 RepID=A0A6A1VYX2_9ROSI|nr:hypothetical protein CJ030_MR3G014585 [Morella rubra]